MRNEKWSRRKRRKIKEHGLLGSYGLFKVTQISQISQKLGRPDGLKIKAKIILKIKAVGILSDDVFAFI